jgi:hypothetical protein
LRIFPQTDNLKGLTALRAAILDSTHSIPT